MNELGNMLFGSPRVGGNPRQHINCGGSVTGSNSNHECGVACYDLVLTATKRNGDKLMDEQKHGRMIDADRLIEFCEKVASVSKERAMKKPRT